MEKVIVWNKRPSKFLVQALKRISEDSLLQAERVEDAILTSIKDLVQNPERYPPDKFKKTIQVTSGHLKNCLFGLLISSRQSRSGYYASGM